MGSIGFHRNVRENLSFLAKSQGNVSQKVHINLVFLSFTYYFHSPFTFFHSPFKRLQAPCKYINFDFTEYCEQLLIYIPFAEVDAADVDSSIAEATATQLEDVDTMVSGWQKMFAVTEEFAKVSGLIAGVAGCVVIGFQIARDFKTDAPVAQKALDICQVGFLPFSLPFYD